MSKLKLSEPTFGKDSCPTEDTLRAVSLWTPTRKGELDEFLGDYLPYLWAHGYGRFEWEYNIRDAERSHTRRLTLATGGWSGNESVVSALQDNAVFWGVFWESSQRGGLHTFTFP